MNYGFFHDSYTAIQHRLNTAGLKRKIGKNQIQAIRIVLTGTHADMEQIEQTARLDEWCQDNLDWLRKTYGADNVVSAVLHMDEETPHIHATIVPIVQRERKKQKKEQTVKKRYRTKVPAPRLCADEVMSRANLIRYQDTPTQSRWQHTDCNEASKAQKPSTFPHMSIIVV